MLTVPSRPSRRGAARRRLLARLRVSVRAGFRS
jgi:hypothetical protein